MSIESVDVHVKNRIDKILKSNVDQRLYRGYQLKNGMKLLLISDKDAERSAASLDVCVGAIEFQLTYLLYFYIETARE